MLELESVTRMLLLLAKGNLALNAEKHSKDWWFVENSGWAVSRISSAIRDKRWKDRRKGEEGGVRGRGKK